MSDHDKAKNDLASHPSMESAEDESEFIADDFQIINETEAWQPTPFFFYGSLMVPWILQDFVTDKSMPTYKDATINGFKSMKWGIYPILIRAGDEAQVKGKCYVVRDAGTARRLEQYEGPAYTWCEVDIKLEDNTVVRGRVFIFSGPPDSPDIEEGVFDLEAFMRQQA